MEAKEWMGECLLQICAKIIKSMVSSGHVVARLMKETKCVSMPTKAAPSETPVSEIKSAQKSPARAKKMLTMLTGPDLLAKVKELGDASKSELVRSCGYVSSKKDGSERLNYTAFYEALLEAKGMNLGESHGAKPGRKLSFNTKVQFNGNLMVGKAYTSLLDLKPGDEFEIKLGRRQIRLTPLGVAPEGEASDDDMEAPEEG